MSTQISGANLIDKLHAHVAYGEKLLGYSPFQEVYIRRFILRAREYLRELYSDDSELMQEFNATAKEAGQSSDLKEGQRAIMRFLELTITSLTTDVIARVRGAETAAGGLRKLFVAHGRSPIWSRVVNHLREDLCLIDVEAFESASRTSEHIVDILEGFLDTCDAAVIVMTADDKTAEGTGRARQNVIHEIGLFQGRYGFNRVILLQQLGTEDFSNIAGLQTVRFVERVEEAFYDLDRAVRRLQA